MKNTIKMLGTILTLCMVFTTLVAAIPQQAAVVADVSEKSEISEVQTEKAYTLSDEDIIVSWEFNEADTKTNFVSVERTNYVPGSVTWDFVPDDYGDESTKYVSVKSVSDASVTDGLTPSVYFRPSSTDANSYYGFTATDVAAIDRIEMRVRLSQYDQYAKPLNDNTTVQIQGSYCLLANRTISKTQVENWIILTVTPDEFLNMPANNTLGSLRFYVAPGLYDGWEFDVDYIRVYKKSAPKYTAVISVDGQTLVTGENNVYFDSGIFTFTFDKAPGVEASKFTYDVLGDTANNFKADGTLVSDDGLTYTVFARKDLRGTSITFADRVGAECEYKLSATANFAGNAKEGHNVFVNGDFENPHLNKWQIWGTSNYTSVIEDGAMDVTFGASNANFSFFAYNPKGTSALKKGEKYLVRIDVTFPSANQPSALGEEHVNLYPYILSSATIDFRANEGKYFEKWQSPAKYTTINNILNANSIILNYPGRHDAVQSCIRVFDTSHDAITESQCATPYIFMAPYSSGVKIADLEGLNYRINKVSVKELFTVAFDADGGEGTQPENALYAYGEKFYFPANTYTKANGKFVGWEYNGKTYGAGEYIVADVTGDGAITLKAVWETDYTTTAPQSYSENSIRTDENPGIRFKAKVVDEQREIAVEYGFIATRSTILGNNGLSLTDLTFDMADGTYVCGKAYVKNTTDRIYETLDDGIIFTGVVTGIPALKHYYEEEIVARPYIIYGDGNIVYGEPRARSIVSVAQAIRDGGYANLDETSAARIKSILEVCGLEA